MPPLVNVVDAEIWPFESLSQDYSEIFDLFTIDTTEACIIRVLWYWTTASSTTPTSLLDGDFLVKNNSQDTITYSPTMSTQVDTYYLSYSLRIEGDPVFSS